MAIEKGSKRDQGIKLILKGAIIWLLAWLLLVGVETIFRLIKGSPPLPSIILVTIFIYGGLGLGSGFFVGLFSSLMLRMRGKVVRQPEAEFFSMAACIATTIFLYGVLLVNKQFLYASSYPILFLGNILFIFFCLFTLVVLYLFFRRIVQKSHLLSSFLALSLSVDLFMIGGLYVNENLVAGKFFTFNLMNILANGSIIISCILFYFLLYTCFRFLSDKIPRLFNFKIPVVVLTTILIVGTIGWYIQSDSIPTAQEPSVHLANKLKGKPNVILITLDTTRADHLSCYGYRRKTTPHLDKFAKESLLFRNAYSTASWTLPAHASLFTGLYPSKHGAHGRMDVWVWDLGARLSDQFTTLAEVLRNESYRTAGVIGGPFCSSHFGLAQGFDYYNDDLLNIKPDLDYFMLYKIIGRFIPLRDLAFRYGFSGARIASQINDIVFNWLDKNYEYPFFLFINYYDSHSPFAAPSPYDRLYEGKDEKIIKNPKSVEKEINYCVREWALIQSVLSGKHNLSVKEKNHFISQYDGKISCLDFHLGKLFQKLKSLDIYDQTMIIVASDHGESFGEHHLMFHNLALYDNLLKVPLIIKYPSSMKKTGIVEYPVSLVDILPEILITLKISVPDQIQGLPLGEKRLKGIIAENYKQKYFVKLFPHRFDKDLRTIIKDNFKYIWSSDGKNELYDLSRDPQELHNLVDELPRKGKEMQTTLDMWLDSDKFTVPKEKLPKMDEKIREDLRALGYIQ